MESRPLNCLGAAACSAFLYSGRWEGCNRLSWMQYRFDIALFIDCDTMDLGALNDRICPPFEMWISEILILGRNCHHDLLRLFPLWLPSLLLLYWTDGHHMHTQFILINTCYQNWTILFSKSDFAFQKKIHKLGRTLNALHWWPWHSFLYLLSVYKRSTPLT